MMPITNGIGTTFENNDKNNNRYSTGGGGNSHTNITGGNH